MPGLEFLKDNWDKLWILVLVPLAKALHSKWKARAARKSAKPPALPPADPRELRLRAKLKSTYFANQPDGETCVLENALLLLSARPLSEMFYFVRPLELIARSQRQLVVIAPDITGEALATMVTNLRRGNFVCCAVALDPMPDPHRTLREIRAKTGATIFGDEAWISLSELTPSDFGELVRIEAGPEGVLLVVPEAPPQTRAPALTPPATPLSRS